MAGEQSSKYIMKQLLPTSYFCKGLTSVLLILLSCITRPVFSQILGLNEGAACRSDGTCKKLSNCPNVDVRVSRPQICSFDHGDYSLPIVCCPPINTSSVSTNMCRRYDRMSCSAVAIARFKRNADGISFNANRDEESDDEETVLSPRILPGAGRLLKKILGRGDSDNQNKVTPSGKSSNLISNEGEIDTATVDSNDARATVMNGTVFSVTTNRPKVVSNVNSTMANSTIDWDNLPMTPKVIGGIEALPRELPYMALIGYGAGPNNIDWGCGGTIISERFVLTAAHCARTSYQGVARWVRVGELDLSRSNDDSKPKNVRVIQRYIHPEYKDPAVYNDIALLKLEQDLEFDSWVQPICLHAENQLKEGRAVAAGWGRTDFVGPTSDSLRKVDLSIYDGEECRRLLGRAGRFLPQGVDTKIMICAGERAGGKDTCTGDSGGPLVVTGAALCIRTQIGVVSFGRQCALPNMPAIYTRVSHYVPWIEKIVWPS